MRKTPIQAEHRNFRRALRYHGFMRKGTGIHSVLLTETAKRILGPLGLVQKGRSRTWLADQDWWMIAVEFQPSGWSQGSYLNVGSMWLWNVKSYMSFDEGYRVEGFAPFESVEQFRPIAEHLVRRAAESVSHYRSLFPTVQSVSDFYLKNCPHAGWPSFNAAVAHGLSGRIEAAKQMFSRWGDEAVGDSEWIKHARLDTEKLLGLVGDQEGFRDLISTRVLQTRELHRLPTRTEVDFANGVETL